MNARKRGCEEHKAQFVFISLRLCRGKDSQEWLAQLLVIPNTSSFYHPMLFIYSFIFRAFKKNNNVKNGLKKQPEGSFCALQCI